MVVLTLFILTCFCLFFDSAISLEVELILEDETVEYKNTVMECRYDLEGATFGYVTWDKNGEKFFEYNRRRIPHKTVHPVAGINLDVDKSNMTHVVLLSLSPESSGEYTCTVGTSGGGIQAARSRETMTTLARDPTPLLVTTRKGLFLINTKNYSAATSREDGHPVYSVGYHYTDGTIFFGTSTGEIIHQDFHESENDTSLGGSYILAEEGQVTSIAVDWLRDMLYFTDDMLDNIARVNLTSEVRETLLDSTHGVNKPESIVVDPFQGYLFWGDNNERDTKIVASALDGKTNRRTIVSSDIKRAILALDLDRRRIFFISNEGLSSCKYDGSATRLHIQHPMLGSNVNSLSYYDDFIFWSCYDTGKSSSGLFFVRLSAPEVSVKELPIKSILDVKVFHQDMQKRSLRYFCELLECSDSCVTDSSGSAHCTCPEGSTLSAGSTVCSKATRDENCEKSLTTVNLKPVCKGELVFEDNFDSGSLDPGKWQHTVRISSDHEAEFVIFDKDKKNTYIKDGNLVMKPTLIDDNIVSTGNITLIGCTTPNAHFCERQAFTYNIIPPVKSGLINTGHSFNFRYGSVTMRAKLPRGDWIYPVLNLQATRDFYKGDYRSGVMRIASVRGNEQLTCDSQEWGIKNLMSGVMMGPALDVKKYFIKKLANKDWSDDFHIFKFTWTPDQLSFSVDDQESENILPEGKSLREVLGLPKDSRISNSRLDPLDQDFYLSVGVSAGGGLEFPDQCTNGGGSDQTAVGTKPWKNFEVKGLLKFWQKKPTWSQRWSDDSALLIDYISVRAL